MNIKLGLGDFWENISTATIDALWNIYTPNVDDVLSCLLIESSTPMEERTELYMQSYIRSLSADHLSIFVQFCTGSTTIDPGSQIKVILHVLRYCTVPEMSVVTNCSKQFAIRRY